VSRARITHVEDLLRLAPDIQEAVPAMPRVERGRDPIHGRDLYRVAAAPLGAEQRRRGREFHSMERAETLRT